MKRIQRITILFILLFLSYVNVSAQDTIYSLNKYKEEELNTIISGYKEDNKKDGFITIGSIKNKDDTQLPIIVKFKKTGEIVWSYTHFSTEDESIVTVNYSYQNNVVDGYLLLLHKKDKDVLVKVDLLGINCWERELDGYYEKMVLITDDNNDNVMYLLIGEKDDKAIIDTYNMDISFMERKEFPKDGYHTSFKDIASINKNQYALLYNSKKDEEENYELWLIDWNSQEIKQIDNPLDKYEDYHLYSNYNSFILYGVTSEVKLKKGEESYYLIKYNQDGNMEWESVGNIPIDPEKPIVLREYNGNYYLLYENGDSSKEVILLDQEGIYKEKIKKINNNYYTFNNFYVKGKTLYIVGQIRCGEDDDCNYKTNSLFLVSGEEKVIEVEDNASTGILICAGLLVVLTGFLIVIKKRRKI